MSSVFSKTVYFVDVDETLIHQPKCLIHIRDYNNVIVDSIDNETFNNYHLQPGYSYDFSEFSDAKRFVESAQPIDITINKLKTLIKNNINSPQKDLILILTARGDFDDKEKILAFFEKQGIPIKKYDFIDFVRTGNISDKIWSTPVKKQSIVLSSLITNRFNKFVMFDDSIHNLEKFYDVKKALINPDSATFEFNHIIHDVIDGVHCNYQIIHVKDSEAKKYIEIYKAKRTLEKYGIKCKDPSLTRIKVGKRHSNKNKQ